MPRLGSGAEGGLELWMRKSQGKVWRGCAGCRSTEKMGNTPACLVEMAKFERLIGMGKLE